MVITSHKDPEHLYPCTCQGRLLCVSLCLSVWRVPSDQHRLINCPVTLVSGRDGGDVQYGLRPCRLSQCVGSHLASETIHLLTPELHPDRMSWQDERTRHMKLKRSVWRQSWENSSREGEQVCKQPLYCHSEPFQRITNNKLSFNANFCLSLTGRR